MCTAFLLLIELSLLLFSLARLLSYAFCMTLCPPPVFGITSTVTVTATAEKPSCIYPLRGLIRHVLHKRRHVPGAISHLAVG